MLSLMKSRRQELILELIDGEGLRSQEQLRRRLAKAGFEATQATISRDINPDTVREALERAAGEYLRKIDRVQQLVVIRTGAGQAQTLAVAIDRARPAETVGTIAGDDTILVIAKDGRRAATFAKRLGEYAGL